jgi:exopolyphosphatase / guanosine-5'-triphosphate,3'-diphosphate pyrophosphatase
VRRAKGSFLLGPVDEAVIAGQLGRTPRDVTGVPVRCSHGFPVVIETAPVLSDGSPNPTLLYLTCPVLTVTVSGLEAAGGVRAFKRRCEEDRDLLRIVEAVTELYRKRRRDLLGEGEGRSRLDAGIGGPATPVRATCLHAHAAAFLAVRAGWLRESSRAGDPTASDLELAEHVTRIWGEIYADLSEPWCSDARCARWRTAPLRAVVDVGTISVRLLVARVCDRRVEDVVRRAEVTRLGEGLEPGGSLSIEAKARTAVVVDRFLKEALTLGAESTLIVGTSAARDAADGRAFVGSLGTSAEAARTSAGVEAMVLTGSQEASAAYAGVCVDIPGSPVVLDIGGGSTELTHRTADGPLDMVSLQLGASRATGRWLTSDPPAAEELARIREEAGAAFAAVRTRFGVGGLPSGAASGSSAPGDPVLVGVAGTVTTLACLEAQLDEYDRVAVHLSSLSVDAVRRLTAWLAAMSSAERAQLPCVQAGRAPVIVAGSIILLAAMETLGFDRLVVSERDLLDGLILRGAC